MTAELLRAAEIAASYISRLDTCPVSESPPREDLFAALDRPLSGHGLPGTQVIDELAKDIDRGLLHSAGGRFFGWVIGGGVPAAIAADWLCSVWDQNAGAYACSPGASVIEDIAGRWLKEILGLPDTASYSFVTGCQMAHFVCLAAARHQVLAQHGWSVEEKGLFGAPAIRVLVGEHHETLLRAIRWLGIGGDAVLRVARHDDGTIDADDLDRALGTAKDTPTIVSLAAGDLNRGAFDDFDRACDIAHRHGAWVHVDGAFGLWVAASPRYRHLVSGIEKADSWATDAHKWLNVPYENGIGFVANPASHLAAMQMHADYVIDSRGGRDQKDWNPEWSKRARAIPIYAALRSMGRNGVAELIERCCDLTTMMVEKLAELPGIEILTTPIVNQGLVRFLDSAGTGNVEHDLFTEKVVERIQRDGEAWFGPTTWEGMRVMRISVSSWRSTEGDVLRAVNAVSAALAATIRES